MRIVSGLGASLVIAAALACDDPYDPTTDVVVKAREDTIAVITQAGQSVTLAIAVDVTDGSGNPRAGVRVEWLLLPFACGSSCTPVTQLFPTTTTTTTEGRAVAGFVVNGIAGTFKVTASAIGFQGRVKSDTVMIRVRV